MKALLKMTSLLAMTLAVSAARADDCARVFDPKRCKYGTLKAGYAGALQSRLGAMDGISIGVEGWSGDLRAAVGRQGINYPRTKDARLLDLGATFRLAGQRRGFSPLIGGEYRKDSELDVTQVTIGADVIGKKTKIRAASVMNYVKDRETGLLTDGAGIRVEGAQKLGRHLELNGLYEVADALRMTDTDAPEASHAYKRTRIGGRVAVGENEHLYIESVSQTFKLKDTMGFIPEQTPRRVIQRQLNIGAQIGF